MSGSAVPLANFTTLVPGGSGGAFTGGSLLDFLFPPAAAAGTIGSYDQGVPGGIVQIPRPPGYTGPGITPDMLPPPEQPVPLPGSDPNASGPITSDGGTVTVRPGITTGWFYDWQAGRLRYQNADGTVTDTAPNAAGQQVPGLGGVVNPPLQAAGAVASSIIPSINWIEELAIRIMLVVVGLVLILGGFYVAGQRSSQTQLVVSSPARTARNIGRVLAS